VSEADDQRYRGNANGSGGSPGGLRLSDEVMCEMADAYLDRAAAEIEETGDVDSAALDRWLYENLVTAGVSPESIEDVFARIRERVAAV
jgi:hypothetical protein